MLAIFQSLAPPEESKRGSFVVLKVVFRARCPAVLMAGELLWLVVQ